MNVKELKEILKNIPDNYEIRTRSENSNLEIGKIPWNLYFSGIVKKVEFIHSLRTLMIINN